MTATLEVEPVVEPATRARSALARLRLRRLLRRTREDAGLTQPQVAAALNVSATKVLRAESGERIPPVPDVLAMLTLYGAEDMMAEAERLAAAARSRSWTSGFHKVLSAGDIDCWTLEPHAALAHYVDIFGIHPLLRTEEFARRWVHAGFGPPWNTNRGELLVQAWRSRRRLLDDPPQLRWFLSEAVCHRSRVDPVMARQWRHIMELAQHPLLDIAIVPYGAGLPPTRSSFTILELADPKETLVYLEDPYTESLVRTDSPRELQWRRHILTWIENAAVPISDCRCH